MQELSDLWTFVTAWYNLPFSLALLLFLGLSALQFIGLDQDHDADVDADADLDLDHDLDIDHDADLDHDLDHDVDHDLTGAPGWLGALKFLGVGQAPVTMILLLLVGSFGLLGWIANWLLLGVVPAYPGWGLIAVLGGALVLSVVVTSRTARLIGRAIPAFASTATSASQLVARRGRVISSQVDQIYGQVKVRDPGGTLITVFAKVDPDKPAIPRDTEVYLVDYDAARKVYTVVPSD
ncbi:MAG: YqiJ family protein [Anaerolineae bacterium]|nr:YqiJ family protein [Anaerolineae bacterium]